MRKSTGNVKKVFFKSNKGNAKDNKTMSRGKQMWQVRFTYTDAEGKKQDIKRLFATKSVADQHLWELQREHSKGKRIARLNEDMTFADAAQQYTELKLIPAKLTPDGRKVAGLKELSAPKAHLKNCLAHFGKRKLRTLTHTDLERFRLKRLDTPTRTGTPRSIRTVNGELQMLNSVLTYAERNGWIEKNPFKQGEPLIRKAEENSRSRVMSYEEEARLLAVCSGEREHLRPLIIIATDCGLRRGELLKLEWSDVDFAERLLRLPAHKTKTAKARDVAMTTRVFEELTSWQERTPQEQANVFAIKNNFKRAWRTACRLGKVEGLNFHDLRHTHCTRAIAAGVPAVEVMKTSGHATMEMLNRYVNPGLDSVRRVASALDTHRKQNQDVLFENTNSLMVN